MKISHVQIHARALELCWTATSLWTHRLTIFAELFTFTYAIAAIRDHLTSSATEQLIHSLVSSRLDYCNSLLYGVQKYKIKYLQRVQNIAARIVTRCPQRDHITPYLQSLHWLPVECCIIFKILLLAYKCMNNLAPNYLSELITPYNQDRYPTKGKFQHRYNNALIFKKKSYGERSFTFAAPTEWSKLPLEGKQASSVDSFKPKLKTPLQETLWLINCCIW